MTSFDFAKREADARDQRRTPKGWPRPRQPNKEGIVFPVAWITLAPDFVSMDAERGTEAIEDRLCQICGEGHAADADVVIFLEGGLRDSQTMEELHVGYDFDPDRLSAENTRLDEVVLKCQDGAMLHERCARLAVGTCPHLRRAKTKGRLFGFAGPVSEVFLRKFDGRPTEVYMPGSAVRVWIMPER